MDKAGFILMAGAILGLAGIFGWIITTWMRVKNGYPLESESGEMIYPGAGTEAMERVKLLTTENAHLRAELGSIKDRLATVERIVIEPGYQLDHQIERLRTS